MKRADCVNDSCEDNIRPTKRVRDGRAGARERRTGWTKWGWRRVPTRERRLACRRPRCMLMLELPTLLEHAHAHERWPVLSGYGQQQTAAGGGGRPRTLSAAATAADRRIRSAISIARTAAAATATMRGGTAP